MPAHLPTSSSTFSRTHSARYYNSALSIWLSVDPMADKYPGLSPYTYCTDNPVRLVDPDGREVHLRGDAQQEGIDYLQALCPHLNFKIKGKNNRLTYTFKDGVGMADLTYEEQKLCDVIDCDNVSIMLEITNSEMFAESTRGVYHSDLGCAFGGSKYKNNSTAKRPRRKYKKNGRANAEQHISLSMVKIYYEKKDIGKLIAHELTEAFWGGKYAIKHRTDTCIPWDEETECPAYNYAHGRALPQPETRFEKMGIPRDTFDFIYNYFNQIKQKMESEP